jgi:hypothetical protein
MHVAAPTGPAHAEVSTDIMKMHLPAAGEMNPGRGCTVQLNRRK